MRKVYIWGETFGKEHVIRYATDRKSGVYISGYGVSVGLPVLQSILGNEQLADFEVVFDSDPKGNKKPINPLYKSFLGKKRVGKKISI